MSDEIKKLQEWLVKRCSSMPEIVKKSATIKGNSINVMIITEAHTYADVDWIEKMDRFGNQLDADIKRMYPLYDEPLIDLRIPDEGSSPEEILALAPDGLVIVAVGPKTWVN